jgi:hypothetical protein
VAEVCCEAVVEVQADRLNAVAKIRVRPRAVMRRRRLPVDADPGDVGIVSVLSCRRHRERRFPKGKGQPSATFLTRTFPCRNWQLPTARLRRSPTKVLGMLGTLVHH